MNKDLVLRIVATLAFAGTIVVNALANSLPINNLTTGEVSDLYPSLFTPAGITFSIWSVIYFLLIAFLIYNWIHRQDQFLTSLLPWFIATCILNMIWIMVWHNLMTGLSVIIMLAFLYTLIRLFLRIQKSGYHKRGMQFMVALPFTLYLAWISVATIANISTLLVDMNWSGGFLSTQQWTVVMMFVAAALACKVVADHRTAGFGVVVIWALIGIFIRWKGSEYTAITYTAIIFSVLIAVNIFYFLRRKKPIT